MIMVNILVIIAVLFILLGIYTLLMNAQDRKNSEQEGREEMSILAKLFSISKEEEEEGNERDIRLEKYKKKLERLGFNGKNLEALPEKKKKKVLKILDNGSMRLYMDQLQEVRSVKKSPKKNLKRC